MQCKLGIAFGLSHKHLGEVNLIDFNIAKTANDHLLNSEEDGWPG